MRRSCSGNEEYGAEASVRTSQIQGRGHTALPMHHITQNPLLNFQLCSRVSVYLLQPGLKQKKTSSLSLFTPLFPLLSYPVSFSIFPSLSFLFSLSFSLSSPIPPLFPLPLSFPLSLSHTRSLSPPLFPSFPHLSLSVIDRRNTLLRLSSIP